LWFAILSNNSQRGTIYSQEYYSARTITVAGTRLTKGLLTSNLDQIKPNNKTESPILYFIFVKITISDKQSQRLMKLPGLNFLFFTTFFIIKHGTVLTMNVNVMLNTLGMLSYETNKFKKHPPKVFVMRHTNILVNNEQKELISYNHF